MKRWMYRALWKASQEKRELFFEEHGEELDSYLEEQGVRFCLWFESKDQIFLYLETSGNEEPSVIPGRLGQLVMQEWPGTQGPRPAVPLMDIFHDGEPESRGVDADQWRSSRTVQRYVGVQARLKPEMYCRYVFYHYQLQEEQPSSFNQSYMIGAHENVLFAFYEMPATLENPKREGFLKTAHTPGDWQQVMKPHFIPWTEEGQDSILWREMDIIYSYNSKVD